MATKALVLLSGGLDSMLAVKVLQAQGIEVEGICFSSNFFNADRAREAAEKLNIPLHVVDISQEQIDLTKNPPSGYGKNMNPCIDCHAMMIRKAGERLTPIRGSETFKRSGDNHSSPSSQSSDGRVFERQEGFDFVATGEVLGQRPFSQNKDALERVQKLSGVVNLLRPLSAKLLPETEIEKNGWVVRGRLLDISGRTRERQMQLAQKYNIEDYPSPAGGCLLTDPEFSQRLAKMFDYWPECNNNDIELLKNGRIFWLNSISKQKILLIVGRELDENNNLEALAQKGDFVLQLKHITGPVTLIRGIEKANNSEAVLLKEIPEIIKLSQYNMDKEKKSDEITDLGAILTGYYSKKARGKKVEIEIKIVK